MQMQLCLLDFGITADPNIAALMQWRCGKVPHRWQKQIKGSISQVAKGVPHAVGLGGCWVSMCFLARVSELRNCNLVLVRQENKTFVSPVVAIGAPCCTICRLPSLEVPGPDSTLNT